jgi:hypothetical protein
MIAGMDIKRGIFHPVRCHEAEQRAAVGIHSGLIREPDTQEPVVAEQRGRVANDGSGGEARAGIGNWWDRGKRIGCPNGAKGKKGEGEDGVESFGGRIARNRAHG